MQITSDLINKDIFSWALVRANKTQNDVLKKFPMFPQWLSDKKQPTIKQLQDFSQSFSFPFGYFFLNSIPKEEQIIPFFRTVENTEFCLEVEDTVKIIKRRQEWVSEYLKNEGNSKVSIVGTSKNDTNVSIIIQKIQETLNLEKGFTTKQKTNVDAISFIKSILENIGVFVVFNGIVGNNVHRTIPVLQCRGFCLIDDYAPFIFINSQDSKSAQLFTLLHETVHIFMAFNAGFGYEDCLLDNITNENEVLCDKVAANILVPSDLIKDLWKKTNDIRVIADKFCVSCAVILRRLLDENLITKDEFFEQWDDYKFSLQKKQNKKNSGGNFYNIEKNRIGERLLFCLNSAIQQNKISPVDAYSIAGIKGDTFHKLVEGLR